jgi:hypothetical protein
MCLYFMFYIYFFFIFFLENLFERDLKICLKFLFSIGSNFFYTLKWVFNISITSVQMYMVRKSKFISLRFKNGLKWKLVWTVSQQVELSFIFLPPMQIAQILCTSFFFRKFIWKRFENMLKVKKCQKVWNNWQIYRENRDCYNRIQGCPLSQLQFVEKIRIVIIVFKDVLYHIFNL